MVLAIVWQVLAALVTAVALVVAELVVAIALNVGTGGLPQEDGDPPELACSDDRRIILIHGTDSTGHFDPDDLVRGLDPDQPVSEVFDDEHRQKEFDLLLQVDRLLEGGPVDDCLLTFSYDDRYLVEGGAWRRGLNAWNRSTSPWNVRPDELADRLQALMDAYPDDVTFDIVAYSAGGIVPTYWAARDETTNAQRARVHSIVVVDGIVWGVELDVFDWACVVWGLRQAEIGTMGKIPCQFRATSPYTRAVRTTDWWTRIPLATIRARGDLIVWHRFAGLPGKTDVDPAIVAILCALDELLAHPGKCVLDTHGHVLGDQTAIATLPEVITRGP